MTETIAETTIDAENPINKLATTTDIYLASYLHTLGKELLRVRSIGPIAEFTFKDVNAHEVLVYHNGAFINISPRKLFDSFQNMRRISKQMKFTKG